MGKGKVVSSEQIKKSDRDTYWVEVDGSPVAKVPLRRSREVALEPRSRRLKRPNHGERHKVQSARLNPESDGITDSGIQIYRLWFRFLKLALELEDIGVTRLVTKQTRQRRDVPAGQGVGSYWQLKDTIPFKIKKEKYEGWDLDQVLKDPFDKWWKTHSYLFEGYPPKIIESTGNLDPDFLYIRIDKKSKLSDVRDFITSEVQSQLTGKPRFEVDGYPRPDGFQNHYNALILRLKGWGAQEICTGGAKEAIYLRATDPRSKDDRLSVGVVEGKTLWSSAVRKQMNYGLHSLQEVMQGKFGSLPSDTR